MESGRGQAERYSEMAEVDGRLYRLSIGRNFGGRPGEARPAHNHFQYELHAAAGGSCEIVFEEKTVALRAGEGCLIRPGVYHRRKDAPGAAKCYDLRIDCADYGLPFPDGADYVRLRCAASLIRYFGLLENELRERHLGFDAMAKSLCAMTVTAILRELSGFGKETSGSPDRAGDMRDELIDSFFATSFSGEARAPALASRLGITVRQLARVMQRLYGCGFRQRLLETRLYHARQLLASSAMPVWQVASCCGFSSAGSFSTAFRASMGCTPSQYRLRRHGLL